MKPWETIRLLLACQCAHQRLSQLDAQRKELKQQLLSFKRKIAAADTAVQQARARYASISSEELAKESEIENGRARKEKLEAELSTVRSNPRYREISEEIQRCEEKIRELEDAELDVLERKESKAKALQEAQDRRDKLIQMQEQGGHKVREKPEDLDEEKRHEIEQLRQIETQFPDGERWFRCFKKLIEGGKLDAVVEVDRGVCPGCHLFIPPGLRQEACALNHLVTCYNCSRIIFSTAGASMFRLTNTEIENGCVPLPHPLALTLTTRAVRIRDVWGNWHEGTVDGNLLKGLKELFAAHALDEGDKVRLLRIRDNNSYRFEPELVSDRDLERISQMIMSSEQPLRLEAIVADELAKKLTVYGLNLLSFELRSKLERRQSIYFRGDLVWHNPLLELRGPPRVLPPVAKPPQPPIDVQSLSTETTVTLTEDAIIGGKFQISAAFQVHFVGVNSGDPVTIEYGVSEDFVLEFDITGRVLKGTALRDWYHFNGLESGDKVSLKVSHPRHKAFHIHTEWKRDFNRLLEQLRQGAAGYAGPPRDLLHGLLTEANQALHYRDLWFRATEVGRMKIGTVVSTLSRYNRRLFCNVGVGCWGLVEWPSEQTEKERRRLGLADSEIPPALPDEEQLWKAVHEIETHDLVYEWLKRQGCDFSYAEIAQELGKMLNVNPQHLRESSFLNAKDGRLARLPNGNWTLREFLEQEPPPTAVSTPGPADTELKSVLVTMRWIWIILALAAVGIIALVFFVAKK